MRFLLILAVLLLSTPVWAAIDNEQAVVALMGEAGGQSDEELLAHAYALKNRGTLHGVYGLYAKHTPHYKDEECWQRVSGAWWTALLGDDDPVSGRTEWRSEFDLKLMSERGETPDSMGLYDPIKVGETYFYRLRK